MIPVLLTIRVQWFRLWIPLIVVWILLLPLVLILLPVAVVACLIGRINPLQAFAAFWRLLSALSGTMIEINDGEHAVAVRIY